MKLVDLHADIGYDVLKKRKNGEIDILKRYHVPKWKTGNIDVICMASYFEGTESWQDMQEMILTLKDEIEHCDDVILVKTQEDFLSEKIKAVLSVEGMCGIQDHELERIDWLHEQGIVVASLTWNDENYLATGAKGNSQRGLSEAGIRVVKRMQDLHMIIDVSHANARTFWDIIEHTTGMVIATHSNAKALCDHIRNLDDDQLRAIASRGGVIGAVAAPWFLSSDPQHRDLYQLVQHELYIKDLIGVDYLAFGFDFMDYFDGYDKAFVLGLQDASQAYEVIRELQIYIKNITDIEKISRYNALNILKNAYK